MNAPYAYNKDVDPEQDREDLDNEPRKPISRGRLIWRMALLPLAFSWIGFALMAPLALLDDNFAWAGLAFGLAFGIAILIVQPKWTKQLLTAEPKRSRSVAPQRELDQGQKLLMTSISAALALSLGAFLLNVDIKERSVFIFVAVLLLIDMVRRPLRRAWGLPGSAVGLAVSGGLIVLLMKAIAEGEAKETYIGLAVILMGFDVFEEYRALTRLGQTKA